MSTSFLCNVHPLQTGAGPTRGERGGIGALPGAAGPSGASGPQEKPQKSKTGKKAKARRHFQCFYVSHVPKLALEEVLSCLVLSIAAGQVSNE